MEEVKVWKEVQQRQQLSTNEVPGSHYKPLLTDIARGWLCCVYDYVCLLLGLHVGKWVCMCMNGCNAGWRENGKLYSNRVIEYYELKEHKCSLRSSCFYQQITFWWMMNKAYLDQIYFNIRLISYFLSLKNKLLWEHSETYKLVLYCCFSSNWVRSLLQKAVWQSLKLILNSGLTKMENSGKLSLWSQKSISEVSSM